MKRRGLSPVIGTVLLVSLVLVIAVIVFSFSRGFISERAERAEIEGEILDLCGESDFVVDDVCIKDQTAEDLQGNINTGLKSIGFIAGNNDLNVVLHGFDIFVDHTGGTFSIPSLDLSEVLGFDSNEIETDFFDFGGEVLQVRIIPKIKSQDLVFTCEDKEIVVSPVETCT